MIFDLDDLFFEHIKLDSLIDNLVKIIPGDKLPGPDGFNGFFLKQLREHYCSGFL